MELVERIRVESARAGGYRTLARRSGWPAPGGVSPATLNAIVTGRHTGSLSERTIRGIALALRLPAPRVARLVGQQMDEDLPPFTLPARASRLSAAQRRLVVALVDSLLGEDRGDRTLAEIDRMFREGKIDVEQATDLFTQRLRQIGRHTERRPDDRQ